MQKRKLWLLISKAAYPEVSLITPTLAWIAAHAGVDFECYFEDFRDGRLFARSGSTVLGGRHFEHFNYLNAVADVSYILFGDCVLFRSSVQAFGAPILVDTADLQTLYRTMLEHAGISEEPEILFFSEKLLAGRTEKSRCVLPYFFPDIYYHKRLAYPLHSDVQGKKRMAVLCSAESEQPSVPVLDSISPQDTYGSITLRIAKRNLSFSKGVAFGDPDAIVSQIATLCRENRVAVFGEARHLQSRDIVFNDYTEAVSEINGETAELCRAVDNPVLLGRQTGDGDLFAWGKKGICMQILDPNRPTFPIVKEFRHPWAGRGESIYDREPNDAQLERYARQGKILASLIFHSGEIAHNEAMLNLVEYCTITGLKVGIAVHAARYQTCPQAWELIHVPVENGGALGLVEPLLHSGGRGVMAEWGCAPEQLRAHCRHALKEIEAISGAENLPKGYFAFCDTDLATLQSVDSRLFSAAEQSGLKYFVSCARPGRNLILQQNDNFLAINQSTRCQCYGSPFVRINAVENLRENCAVIAPGWILTTMDSPVVSFNPYIWQRGNRFVEIADYFLHNEAIVNATPHTVARYARILHKMGYLPPVDAL